MNNRREALYGPQHAQDLELVVVLNRAANLHNRHATEVFRKHGLTTMQFAVLEALYHKGDLKVGEIVEKILATGGNMTVVLNNLEREGMVVRCAHPQDSRSWLISITEKGKRKIEDIFPEYLEIIQTFFSVLPEEEKSAVVRSLKKLIGQELSRGGQTK